MEQIPLPTLVDFILTHRARVEIVRRVKDYRHHTGGVTDFYGPFRRALTERHANPVGLNDFVLSLDDARKQRLYAKLVTAYQAWHASHVIEWRPNVRHMLVIGDMEVLVAPPLAMLIDGVPHAVELHCDGEKCIQRRVELLCLPIRLALQHHHQNEWKAAVLDVLHGQLLYPQADGGGRARLGLLMRGEAACFNTIYAGA